MLTSRVAYRMMSSLQHSMGSKLDILPEWLDSTVRNITTASWYTSSCSGGFFPAMRTHKTLQGDCSLHRIFSSWSNKCFTSLPHRSESPNPDWCAPYPCCFNLIYFCVPRFSTYGCSLQGYCKPITSLSWARSQAPFSFQQMPSRLKKKRRRKKIPLHADFMLRLNRTNRDGTDPNTQPACRFSTRPCCGLPFVLSENSPLACSEIK